MTNLELSNAMHACKTFLFDHNVEKIPGTKKSMKIVDHFTCTSANVIYCITYTCCKNLYIGETGGRLDDRFRFFTLHIVLLR